MFWRWYLFKSQKVDNNSEEGYRFASEVFPVNTEAPVQAAIRDVHRASRKAKQNSQLRKHGSVRRIGVDFREGSCISFFTRRILFAAG